MYYIPMRPIYQQCILPTLYLSLGVIRDIFLRERIEIVHCHSVNAPHSIHTISHCIQAFSTLALEGLVHAKTMHLKTVFTDHSLFGFADLSSIIMNKLLQWTMTDADRVICVSHTSKENTVIRAYLDPSKVFVIPNAIDASIFTPAPDKIDTDFSNALLSLSSSCRMRESSNGDRRQPTRVSERRRSADRHHPGPVQAVPECAIHHRRGWPQAIGARGNPGEEQPLLAGDPEGVAQPEPSCRCER